MIRVACNLKQPVRVFVFLFPALFWITLSFGEPCVKEDFATLDNWEPVLFPKIENHTTYEIEGRETGSVLKTRSSGSASGIRYRDEFDVYDCPRLRWRWRVENVYRGGDARRKSGDDYPLQVYIMFKYDPDRASFGESMTYGLAKLVYGAYPPHSSLKYIWASRTHERKVYPSAYTDRVRMIIMRSGAAEVGTWLEEDVDIVTDYERAFGEKPPATASIAVMNDSDNTGEAAVSYVDYIIVGDLNP